MLMSIFRPVSMSPPYESHFTTSFAGIHWHIQFCQTAGGRSAQTFQQLQSVRTSSTPARSEPWSVGWFRWVHRQSGMVSRHSHLSGQTFILDSSLSVFPSSVSTRHRLELTHSDLTGRQATRSQHSVMLEPCRERPHCSPRGLSIFQSSHVAVSSRPVSTTLTH